MKHGTEYAKRIRKLFKTLLSRHGKPTPVEPADPIEQMLIGILAEDSTDAKAQAVFHRIRQQMVDLNELRVTPAIELQELIGDGVPLAASKARRMVDALNAIRRLQDTLDLSFLKQRTRREAREYLESLDGVSRAAAARVVLFSLGGHAIPVDHLTLYVLRKEDLVDPTADVVEVQGFLERHVAAVDAPAFAVLMSRHATTHAGRVDLEKLPALLSPPPPPPVESAPVVPAAVEPAPAAVNTGKSAPAAPTAPAPAKSKADKPDKSAAVSKGSAAAAPAPAVKQAKTKAPESKAKPAAPSAAKAPPAKPAPAPVASKAKPKSAAPGQKKK